MNTAPFPPLTDVATVRAFITLIPTARRKRLKAKRKSRLVATRFHRSAKREN